MSDLERARTLLIAGVHSANPIEIRTIGKQALELLPAGPAHNILEAHDWDTRDWRRTAIRRDALWRALESLREPAY